MQTTSTFTRGADAQGQFGSFGGRFVAESLMPLILDLEESLTSPERRRHRFLNPRQRGHIDTNVKVTLPIVVH